MPEGDQHHALAALMRNRPELINAVLDSGHAGEAPPGHARLRESSENLSILSPLKLDADNILVFEDGRKMPVFGIVFEVQRSQDRRKRFRWVLYYYVLRDRLNELLGYPVKECPVVLLVFATAAASQPGRGSPSWTSGETASCPW